MPVFESGPTRLYYEESGDPDGPAVLLIAPGGMHSALSRWSKVTPDPRRVLTDHRVIAMDQRNAGRSSGPIEADHGWHTYTADQLALLDHLGVDRFAVVGMCIGGPYGIRLAVAAPDRVTRAVLFQPIGLQDNRPVFFDLFDAWARSIAHKHPEADEARWDRFRQAMFGGDFLFGATREDAASVQIPVLVGRGGDVYHPESVSRELAELLPAGRLLERWKGPEHVEAAAGELRGFLGG